MHIDSSRHYSNSLFPCQNCKIAEHSLVLIYKSAKDSIQYTGACLVAAAASHYFLACATLPLLTISGTIFLTRTVIIILKKSSSEKMKIATMETLKHLRQLDKKYPRLSNSVLITSLLASLFFPFLSLALGVGYGAYMGMWIEIEKNKQRFRETPTVINVNSSKPLI